MVRNATGVVGLISRAATTGPGLAALEALVLGRLSLALRRGAGLPGAVEVARRARFLADRQYYSAARRLLHRAAGRMGQRPEAVILRLEDRIVDLDQGLVDRRQDDMVLREALDLADQCWAVGQDSSAVDLLDACLRLLFHPCLHFGQGPSALAEDPVAFLSLLRQSRAWQEITTPIAGADRAGHTGQAGPAGQAEGPGPRRVLFISLRNWNFIEDIITDYQDDERFEVRRRDLSELATFPEQRSLLADRAALRRGGQPPRVPAPIAEDLAWAQTIVVEWGSAAAVWTSLVAPSHAPGALLLMRIHSYEASTAMPQLIDWSAVDRLITVSPPIREILRASAPLRQGLGLSTVPNRALLTGFRQPKEPGSQRTLALVGWAALRKDPAWALDVLDLLRAQDPSWRLMLIGPGFPRDLTPSESAYAQGVQARIDELGPAVQITGRTSEVARCLRGVGVILSSSRREGTHEGFIEGAASGALPVVRDWPDVARWGGPGLLFPSSWVVRTPQEAAQRIWEHCDDAEYCRAQSQWMIEHADWTRVRPLYDALLLGEPAGEPPGSDSQ